MLEATAVEPITEVTPSKEVLGIHSYDTSNLNSENSLSDSKPVSPRPITKKLQQQIGAYAFSIETPTSEAHITADACTLAAVPGVGIVKKAPLQDSISKQRPPPLVSNSISKITSASDEGTKKLLKTTNDGNLCVKYNDEVLRSVVQRERDTRQKERIRDETLKRRRVVAMSNTIVKGVVESALQIELDSEIKRAKQKEREARREKRLKYEAERAQRIAKLRLNPESTAVLLGKRSLLDKLAEEDRKQQLRQQEERERILAAKKAMFRRDEAFMSQLREREQQLMKLEKTMNEERRRRRAESQRKWRDEVSEMQKRFAEVKISISGFENIKRQVKSRVQEHRDSETGNSNETIKRRKELEKNCSEKIKRNNYKHKDSRVPSEKSRCSEQISSKSQSKETSQSRKILRKHKGKKGEKNGLISKATIETTVENSKVYSVNAERLEENCKVSPRVESKEETICRSESSFTLHPLENAIHADSNESLAINDKEVNSSEDRNQLNSMPKSLSVRSEEIRVLSLITKDDADTPYSTQQDENTSQEDVQKNVKAETTLNDVKDTSQATVFLCSENKSVHEDSSTNNVVDRQLIKDKRLVPLNYTCDAQAYSDKLKIISEEYEEIDAFES